MDFFGISINVKKEVDNLKLKNKELQEYCNNLELENKDIKNENRKLYEEKNNYKNKYLDIKNQILSLKKQYKNNNDIIQYINKILNELIKNDNINQTEIEKIIFECNKLKNNKIEFYDVNDF
jgi:chromosome segregation ATPase